MSSGTSGIAYVHIANGTVAFTEIWGPIYAPDTDHTVELNVTFTEHGESLGNIHVKPVERTVKVYLTGDELLRLADELTLYAARERENRKQWSRAQGAATELPAHDMGTFPHVPDEKSNMDCPACLWAANRDHAAMHAAHDEVGSRSEPPL